MNIYVGNLPREVNENDLRTAFQPFGQVENITIITDKFTGEPRGFGFVEMPVQSEAEAAIAGLNGQMMSGRALTVNVARPRLEGRRPGGRPGGGGGYGGRGGGRGGRHGGGRGGHHSW